MMLGRLAYFVVCSLCAVLWSINPLAEACAQDAARPVTDSQPATPPDDTLIPAFDPEAQLADIPGLDVAWPDLDDMTDMEGAETQSAETKGEAESERRYTVKIDGLEGIDDTLIRSRFAELSALEQGKGEAANLAQIDRRVRQDEELLATLMRTAGYYDARIRTQVNTNAANRVEIVLDVRPGDVYRFTDVEVRGLETTGAKQQALRDAFGIEKDDVVDADKVLAGEAALREQIGREGFPFAKVGEPEVVVDHEDRSVSLVLELEPGTLRNFGKITLEDEAIFSARHIQTIARFSPGDPYDSEDIDDLRRALIATGLVSSAKIETVPGDTPETVDVAIALEPAPMRTIAGELGYGTGEGLRAEVSWQHRNFLKPEGAVTLRGVLGEQEQLISVSLRRNNFQARDRVLNAQVAAANIDSKAYAARTFSISGNLERQTNIIFQKKWVWSIGGELLASDERDVVGAMARRRTFFIGAFPLSLGYDGSDDLLNPNKGFRLSGRLSPEASFQSSTFSYIRAQIDASGYFPVSERMTLAARTRLGTIYGADRDRIAPSRRFYAGGGGSVRGYTYQSIGPRDVFNDPIGGKSLAEFSLEARVRFGDFGIVPFIDAGNISTGTLPNFKDLRVGAGIGARYYTNFGPIRVDVGTPINPQKGDPRIAVYISLGQSF